MSAITSLAQLTTTPNSNDVIPILDVTDNSMAPTGTTKKIPVTDLLAGVTGAVTSVNGNTGAVTLTASSVGADATGSASSAQSNAESFATSAVAIETTRAEAAEAAEAAALQKANSLSDVASPTSALAQLGLPWLSVTNYGATGNGSTDDTTAVQNAINALPATGGVVLFPAGSYKVSSALTVTTGTTLQGAGIDATEIKQVTSVANGIQGVDVSWITIRDMTIAGPAYRSGDGVKLTRSSNANIPYCTFENVQFATFGNCGIFADVLITSRFAGCIARHPTPFGWPSSMCGQDQAALSRCAARSM